VVELFDAHGVSFVSVTQQFNTTTSMGRLTLNVLLSFAQFEREVTSERIRDKIADHNRFNSAVGCSSHMTKGSLVSGSIPPAGEGHRRRFSATDKRQILEEAMRLGARLSAVARRYGIAGRVLFRWKQE
jgi:site-specific DNA recombinase